MAAASIAGVGIAALLIGAAITGAALLTGAATTGTATGSAALIGAMGAAAAASRGTTLSIGMTAVTGATLPSAARAAFASAVRTGQSLCSLSVSSCTVEYTFNLSFQPTHICCLTRNGRNYLTFWQNIIVNRDRRCSEIGKLSSRRNGIGC